jgi:hypothetical protein
MASGSSLPSFQPNLLVVYAGDLPVQDTMASVQTFTGSHGACHTTFSQQHLCLLNE